MADDARRAPTAVLNALLRSQVEALITRLHMDGAASMANEVVHPVLVERFRRYCAAIERQFTNWHDVARYAKHLGCSEKGLARAARLVADRNAKAVLVDRIVLEAKRLLAHSVLPVASVGDRLGFSEATNFVKFIRRETGLTPGALRAQLTGLRNPALRPRSRRTRGK
jgi:AraC-like DNA-binding protein